MSGAQRVRARASAVELGERLRSLVAQLPSPVAVPLGRHLRPDPVGIRILAGSDAGYALVKYVALVRLADWTRERWPGGDRVDSKQLDHLNQVLLGASADAWWAVGNALAALTREPAAPMLPAWASSKLVQFVNTLNVARRSRHEGVPQSDDEALLARVQIAIVTLIEAALPLLHAPLVRARGELREELRGPTLPPTDHGQWSVLVALPTVDLALDPFALVLAPGEPGGAQDLYVYERLTQRGYVVEHDDTQFELAGPNRTLGGIVSWLAERRARLRAEASTQLDLLGDDALRAALGGACARALDGEWQAASARASRARRPEVEDALSRLPREGVSVLLLAGPSGIGKSFEIIGWLREGLASGRAGRAARIDPALAPVCVFLRAGSWSGESLDVWLGTAANSGVPAVLALERLAGVANHGLRIGVDGVNESRDPFAFMTSLASALRVLEKHARGGVQVVASVRPETARAVLRALDPRWLPSGGAIRGGALEVGPLGAAEAALLWDVQAVGARPFSSFAPAVRRLLQIPLLSALARDALAHGDPSRPTAMDVNAIVESFVRAQTSGLEPVILRRLAAKMFEARRPSLSQTDFERTDSTGAALRERIAVQGEEGPYAEAFRSLRDRGLLQVRGTWGGGDPFVVSFAHDRILQWFAGHWLADARAPEIETGELGELLAPVAGSPALCAAIGQAVATRRRELASEARAHLDARIVDSLQAQATVAGSYRQAAARAAARAIFEVSPEDARAWLRSAWTQAAEQEDARLELLTLAADVGDAETLADGLCIAGKLHDATVAHLSRIRLHTPLVVHEALRERWSRIGSLWLELRDVASAVQALLFVQIAEGGAARPSPDLAALTRDVSTRLLGESEGPGARVLRRLLVEALSTAAGPAIDRAPQGPVDLVRELKAFYGSTARSERQRFRPLVGVFEGSIRPRDVERLARSTATSGVVGATVLLERALVMASTRPATSDDALDLAFELGLVAQRARPIPMAAQGMMYVLSRHLERNPPGSAPARWQARFGQFERLLRGWLATAPQRRWWSPDTARSHKSLFGAAHSMLWQTLHANEPSPILAELWGRAISDQDELLALDILDDLAILGLGRAARARALLELEPLLAASWVTDVLSSRAVGLLAALAERDSELVRAALESARGGANRRRFSRLVSLRPTVNAMDYTLFLDFDDATVLNPRLSPLIARILHGLLEADSFREFLSLSLRLVANALARRDVFALASSSTANG